MLATMLRFCFEGVLTASRKDLAIACIFQQIACSTLYFHDCRNYGSPFGRNQPLHQVHENRNEPSVPSLRPSQGMTKTRLKWHYSLHVVSGDATARPYHITIPAGCKIRVDKQGDGRGIRQRVCCTRLRETLPTR